MPKSLKINQKPRTLTILIAAAVILGVGAVGVKTFRESHAATPGTVSQQMAAIVKTQIGKIDTTVPKPAGSNVTNWPDPNCPRCNAGIGEAAAAAAYVTKDPAMLARAKAVFDDVIAHEPQPGLIVGAGNEGGSPGEGSMFYATSLSAALILLRPQLDAAHIKSYQRNLTYIADWEYADGDMTYYANGNVNIGNAGIMAAAYHETGNPAYLAKYQEALAFVEKPTLPRWAGRGFIITKQATKADGSDGAGYFTETGAGGTGLDIDYTQFQEDQLARIYMINHDPKILYFMNMLMNTLMTKVDTAKMTLETGGGSRHTQPPPRLTSFHTAGFQILVKHGRSDLAQYAAAQQNEAYHFLQTPGAFLAGNLYDLGLNPGLAVMNDTDLFEPTHSPALTTDVVAPAQPGKMTATVTNATTVKLTWTAPTDNTGVTKYFVRRAGPTSNYPYATLGNVTSYTDSAALPNTTYTYSVQAVDAAGNVSIKSTGVTVTTPATSTTVTVGDINNDKRVNAIDLSILLIHDGQNYASADLNKDGTVGAADLAVLLAHWTW